MLMYITDITVNSTAEFDPFALFNTVQHVKTLFFASSAVGSQDNKSPLSRYQNAFVRCNVAASVPYVNMVSKKTDNYRARLPGLWSSRSGRIYTD